MTVLVTQRQTLSGQPKRAIALLVAQQPMSVEKTNTAILKKGDQHHHIE